MNENVSLEDYVKENNLLGEYRRFSSCYKNTELFKGILTNEVLEKFKDYIIIEEYQLNVNTINIVIKPTFLTKYIFTQVNKQPLSSKVNYFICNDFDLRDAVDRFCNRHSHIWQYKDFEVYENDLDHLVLNLSRGLRHKFTKAESKIKYKYKNIIMKSSGKICSELIERR